MRILVVSQYFWPENFRINDLSKSLKDRGHEVTVLTGYPNYPEGRIYDDFKKQPKEYGSIDGVDIIRVPLLPRKNGSISLILNYLSFFMSGSLFGLWKTKSKQFDVIICCQLSPVTAAIPAIVLKKVKKIPLILWSLDLWPESLEAVGQVKSNMVLTTIGKLVAYIYSNCDLILGQSKSYLEAIDKRNKNKTPMDLFPNWAEDIFFETQRNATPSDNLNIMFAGNIGEAQDLGALVECAKILQSNKVNVLFSIVGDGRIRKWLETKVKESGLESYFVFHGAHPLEAMPGFYSKADVALVSLKRDYIFERTIPGKVQSYMMAGLPILSMLDGEGDKLVYEANCGLGCHSGDYRALAQNITSCVQMKRDKLIQLGVNGRVYAQKHFSKDTLVGQLEGYMAELAIKGNK